MIVARRGLLASGQEDRNAQAGIAEDCLRLQLTGDPFARGRVVFADRTHRQTSIGVR